MDNFELPYKIISIRSQVRPADRVVNAGLTQLVFHGRHVALVTLIEIDDPWNPAREASELIAQGVIREFSRSSSNSLLARFETSLKGVNVILDRAQEKIGKLINVAIMIVAEEQVHFSTTGNAKILLYRDGKLNDVSSEHDRTVSHFAAVTSGDLTETDTLAIITNDLSKIMPSANTTDWDENPETVLLELAAQRPDVNKSSWLGFLMRYSPSSPDNTVFFWDKAASDSGFKTPTINIPKINLRFLSGLLPFITKVGRSTTKYLSVILRSLSSIPHLPSSVFRNRLTYISLGLILIIVAGYLFFHRTKTTLTTDSQTTIVDTLKNQIPSSILSFLNNADTVKAYDNLSDDQKQQFQTVLTQLNVKLITLPAVSVELANTAVKLTTVGNNLYLIDTTGQLMKWDGKLMAQIQQATKLVTPVDLVAFGDDKLVGADAAGSLWLFNSSIDSPKSLALPASLPIGSKHLATYGKNLYISTSDGAVYRVTNFDKDVNIATAVTKAGTIPFTSIESLQVPGSFYALSKDGQMVDFKKNTLGKVNISLPFVADTISFIVDTAGNYYFALNNFILKYSATGVLLQNNFIPVSKPITGLAINSAGGFFVTVDKDLYLLPTL